MITDVHIVPVLVSAILAVAVGSVWYSPLIFGVQWMRAIGLTPENDLFQKGTTVRTTLMSIVIHTVLFFALALLVAMSREYAFPIGSIGVLMAVIVLAIQTHMMIWEKRPISYLCINGGYALLALWGGLGIIVYWPW